jgi:MFS family permease
MQSCSAAGASPASSHAAGASTRQILGFVYFTFVVYLSVGLPLAVLPPYVHLQMGFSAALAGLVISIQYIATLVSRPWAGRISDRAGAKVSVLWGMGLCSASGALLIAAAALQAIPWLSLSALFASRLVLGVGESLGSTGATLWGISSAGQASTARVISFNGISTYGAMALGAPLGVILDSLGGLTSIGLLILLLGAFSLALASRKKPVAVTHGEHLPFSHVLGRVAPHGMALALGGVGYSTLATFVTLFYLSRHWSGCSSCRPSTALADIRWQWPASRWNPWECCCCGAPARHGWPSLPPRWPASASRWSFPRWAWRPSSASRRTIAARPWASSPPLPMSPSSSPDRWPARS